MWETDFFFLQFSNFVFEEWWRIIGLIDLIQSIVSFLLSFRTIWSVEFYYTKKFFLSITRTNSDGRISRDSNSRSSSWTTSHTHSRRVWLKSHWKVNKLGVFNLSSCIGKLNVSLRLWWKETQENARSFGLEPEKKNRFENVRKDRCEQGNDREPKVRWSFLDASFSSLALFHMIVMIFLFKSRGLMLQGSQKSLILQRNYDPWYFAFDK